MTAILTSCWWGVPAKTSKSAGCTATRATARSRTSEPICRSLTATGEVTETFPSWAGWGDYDNDGDLDIGLNAYDDNASLLWIGGVWRNEGGTFTYADNRQLRGAMIATSGAWGDYDNDGDLDIVLSGGSWGTYTLIERNEDGVFVEGLEGLVLHDVAIYGSDAWGDYDNDGDLDLLMTGFDQETSSPISRVYRNEAGSFSLAVELTGVAYSDAAWGDFDDDGYLDIVLAGATDSDSGYIARSITTMATACSALPPP